MDKRYISVRKLAILYLNPFGAEDTTFIITVASGAWSILILQQA